AGDIVGIVKQSNDVAQEAWKADLGKHMSDVAWREFGNLALKAFRQLGQLIGELAAAPGKFRIPLVPIRYGPAVPREEALAPVKPTLKYIFNELKKPIGVFTLRPKKETLQTDILGFTWLGFLAFEIDQFHMALFLEIKCTRREICMFLAISKG